MPEGANRQQEEDSIREQLTLFHSQEAKSLAARFRHLENLIGQGHHSPTEGSHCEALAREYLRANLPEKYSVDTGFIRANPVELKGGELLYASPQIDILIHDSHSYSPLYRSGELVVVTPESVAGIIEVKKTLTSGSLKDALVNLARAQILLMQRVLTTSVVFSGVVSFTSKRLPVSSKTLSNRFQELINLGGVLPNSVVCLEDFFINIQWDGQNSCYNVGHFDAEADDSNGQDKLLLSLQYMMSVLYSVQRLENFRGHRFSFPPNTNKVSAYTLAPKAPEQTNEDGAEQVDGEGLGSAGASPSPSS